MPLRARLTPLSIAVLAWLAGFSLAGLAIHPLVGGVAPAWAQRPGAEVEPSEWQRLAGPLPYRPEDAGSGRLREEDVGRAVEQIADLGMFFAKLADTDPNRRAGAIWAKSEAVYSAAAEDLRADLADGRFRVVVTEGSNLAIARRGEEIWIDSDLAGDWDLARVRQARRNGDDWSDLAALSGLLFDLWRARGGAAAAAWLEQQRTTIDLPRESQWESGAGASLLARYGVLKQLYLKASLLRAATADSLNAALWRDRALRLGLQIEALLRQGSGTGPQDPVRSALRDDWAAYQTQIEQTASERTWLVLAPRRLSPARARAGDGPTQPAQVADEAETADVAATDTTIEMIVPAGQVADDSGPAVLKDRIDALEAARSRDRSYIAQLLARTAGAARAARDSRTALAAARSASESEAAALAAARDRAAGYAAEVARLADKLAAAQSAAQLAAQAAAEGAAKDRADLQEQLAAAQDRAERAGTAAAADATVRDAAKDEVARLAAELAAARSDNESAAAAADDLRQEAADLAAELDRARQSDADLQARLAQAEVRAAGAEAEAVRLADTLTALERTADEDRAVLRRQLAAAQDRAERAETAAAAAATVRDAAKDEVARLAAELAAAGSDSESAAAAQDRLRQEAADLTAELDRSRQSEADLQARLAQAKERAAGAEAEAARLGGDLTAAQDRAVAAETDLAAATAAAAAAADLKRQLADRDAEVARLDADAAGRATALSDAEAKIARLESRIATLQATAADGEVAAESERAALKTALSDLQADLTATQAQAAAKAASAREAAEAAAQSGDRAEKAERALAASQDEVARLRETQAPTQRGESAAAPNGPAPWSDAWGIAVAIPLLFLGGLGGLLTVLWRRIARPHAARPATESLAATGQNQPATATAPAPATRPREQTAARRPAARPGAAAPRPPAPVTSATVVEAVRRRDWAAADSQFAELSGIAAPRLGELLAEPSGEMLALACRAADLDRLTFATLYLLQGQGRAVADPETVADAVSLFERTGPAEAHRRLAERSNGKSLSS